MKNQENEDPSQEKILSIKNQSRYVPNVGINRQWFEITYQQL